MAAPPGPVIAMMDAMEQARPRRTEIAGVSVRGIRRNGVVDPLLRL